MGNGEPKKRRGKLPPLSKEQVKEKLSEWLKNNKPKSCPKRKARGTRPEGLGCYAPSGASGLQRATSLDKKEFMEEKAERKKLRKLRAMKKQKAAAIRKEIARRKALQTQKQQHATKSHESRDSSPAQPRPDHKQNKKDFIPRKEFNKKLKYYGIHELEARLQHLTSEIDEKELKS